MGMPKSVVKVKKNGVEYISSVDRVQYTINELTRAALKDVGKFLRKRMITKLKKLPGMKRAKRPYNLQYWVRKRENNLIIGFKHDAWYSVGQEIGDRKQPRKGIMKNTTFENIDEIRRIEGQYLSAIEDENKVLGLIDESEEVGNDEDV